MDASAAVAATGGAAGTGALLLWATKLLMMRLLKQNDDRHEEHEKKFEKLFDKFETALRDIAAKLAAMEVRAAEVSAMRETVARDSKTLAVVEAKVLQLRADLNIAHQRIRAISGAGKGD